MRNVTDWGRLVAAALVAVLAASPALASGSGRATAPAATAAEPAPPGDPLLGIVLIIGIIGVLILAAWLFSRVSDSDDAHPSDKSIV